jgi:hypothetical protein
MFSKMVAPAVRRDAVGVEQRACCSSRRRCSAATVRARHHALVGRAQAVGAAARAVRAQRSSRCRLPWVRMATERVRHACVVATPRCSPSRSVRPFFHAVDRCAACCSDGSANPGIRQQRTRTSCTPRAIFGSMVALLAYPGRHRAATSAGAAEPLVVRGVRSARGAHRVCAFVVRRSMVGSTLTVSGAAGPVLADATVADMGAFNSMAAAPVAPADRLTVWRRARWVLLSFVPSSMLLAGHDLSRDRRRIDPAAVDRSARDLSAHVRPSCSRGTPSSSGTRSRSGCSRRSC